MSETLKSYLCKFLLHLFDLLPQHILDKCPVQYGIAPKEEMFLFSSNFFPAPSPCGPCGLAARFRWLLRLRPHQVEQNHKHNYLKHQFWTEKICFCTYSIKIEEMEHLEKYGPQLFISPGGWRGASKSQMEKWVTFHYFFRVKFFGKFVVILGF